MLKFVPSFLTWRTSVGDIDSYPVFGANHTHTGIPDVLIDSFLLASRNGSHTAIINLMRDNPNIVDYRDKRNGKTALILSSGQGFSYIVKLLLDGGANKDMQDYEGVTALIAAAVRGDREIVRMLLEYGANINIQNENGYTALTRATLRGKTGIVSLLLDDRKGWISAIDIPDKSGETALMWAMRHRLIQISKLIINSTRSSPKPSAVLDVCNCFGYTALIYAAKGGFTEGVRLLCEAGASVDLQTHDGSTALIFAAYEGHHACVPILIRHGALLDIQDSSGSTALLAASYRGHNIVVGHLLRAGACVNLRDKKEYTPLMHASERGCVNVVKVLLQGRVCIDAQDRDGKTALIKAAARDQRKVAELLLQAGADIVTCDNDGCSALYHACASDSNRLAAAVVLLHYDADPWTPCADIINVKKSKSLTSVSNLLSASVSWSTTIRTRSFLSSQDIRSKSSSQSHHYRCPDPQHIPWNACPEVLQPILIQAWTRRRVYKYSNRFMRRLKIEGGYDAWRLILSYL